MWTGQFGWAVPTLLVLNKLGIKQTRRWTKLTWLYRGWMKSPTTPLNSRFRASAEVRLVHSARSMVPDLLEIRVFSKNMCPYVWPYQNTSFGIFSITNGNILSGCGVGEREYWWGCDRLFVLASTGLVDVPVLVWYFLEHIIISVFNVNNISIKLRAKQRRPALYQRK